MRSLRVFLLVVVVRTLAIASAGAAEVSAPAGLLFSPKSSEGSYLAACGSRYGSGEVACVCGWFEDLSGEGVLIDGRPAGPPVTASRNALCFNLRPGRHRISGDPARFAAIEEHEVTVFRIEQSKLVSTLEKRTAIPVTWTIRGTDEPVWLELRNRTPRTGALEGGDAQRVATSGGSPNAVTRVLKARRVGAIVLDAWAADGPGGSKGPDVAREALVQQMFRTGLQAVAARFEAAVRKLPTARDGQLYPREDVARLIATTRDEVLRSLPAPELAAFRDFVEEESAQLLSALEALPMETTVRARASGIQLAAFQTGDRAAVETSAVEPLFERLRKLFALSGGPLLRHLCLRSEPEDQATVKIYPKSFPSDDEITATTSVLTLAIGKYRYQVSKSGFKTIEAAVNLVQNPQEVLDCTLVGAQQEGAASPCRLITNGAGCSWP
jgi:hypothetical protein